MKYFVFTTMNEKSLLELSPLQLVILWMISILLLTLIGVQANGAVLNVNVCTFVSSVETVHIIIHP